MNKVVESFVEQVRLIAQEESVHPEIIVQRIYEEVYTLGYDKPIHRMYTLIECVDEYSESVVDLLGLRKEPIAMVHYINSLIDPENEYMSGMEAAAVLAKAFEEANMKVEEQLPTHEFDLSFAFFLRLCTKNPWVNGLLLVEELSHRVLSCLQNEADPEHKACTDVYGSVLLTTPLFVPVVFFEESFIHAFATPVEEAYPI